MASSSGDFLGTYLTQEPPANSPSPHSDPGGPVSAIVVSAGVIALVVASEMGSVQTHRTGKGVLFSSYEYSPVARL